MTPMQIILLGALVAAIGIALWSVPAGVIALGLSLSGCGVYLDLTDEDDE